MRSKILFLVIIVAISTGVFAFRGSVKQGIYISPQQDLSVEIPSVAELSIMDGGRVCEGCLQHVDFIPKGSYWMMDKAYMLEWFKLNKKPDKKLLMALPLQMKNEFEMQGGILEKPSCRFVKIHAVSAYQCQSVGTKDSVKAGFIGTSMVIHDRLINAYVLYPRDKIAAPLTAYQRFIQSIVIQ